MARVSFRDLGLLPAQLKAIARKAKLAGKTAPEYIRLLIEQDLLAGKPFDEILPPIRVDFSKSGISESELCAIVERARHPHRRNRGRTRRTTL